jgi:hypothetical protein
METNKSTRRFKWLFIGVLLAVGVLAQVGMRYARHVPAQNRGLWLVVLMAVPVIPIAFIYGRNSARRDDLGKLSRAFVVGAVVCVLVGMFLGRQWLMFEGLGAGFLIGYALGWLVQKKAREKYGDTLEGDSYLNITRSEREPKPEHPAVAFLKSQDRRTQRLLYLLSTFEAVLILSALGLSFWLALRDDLGAILRAVYVHPGDGTRYFITFDSMIVAVPLILLSILAFGIASELVIPKLAGARKEVWKQYKTLRETRRRSVRTQKAYTIFLYAALCVAVVALILYADAYVRVTDQGIAINQFWSLGARYYRWNEVSRVEISQVPYMCRNCGHEHHNLVVRIAFIDGFDWVPDTSFARRETQIEAAARYVAERTGY